MALTVLFLALTQLPGDPVAALFGFNRPPPEVYEAIRRQYHLDEPVLQQYLLYLRDVLSGDLGNSYPRDPFSGLRVGTPAMDVVRRTAPVSAVVVLCSLVVQVVVGVTAGALSAGLGRRAGTALYAVALLLVSTPGARRGVRPAHRRGRRRAALAARAGALLRLGEGYVLPVLALSALSTGFVVLLTRGEVRETLAARYVKAARARGIPAGVVLRRHALRPALLPVVAFLDANTGQLFIGLVIVEGVFALPGLGGALFDAVLRQDRSLLMGLATATMAVVIVANACADLLAAALDPRLRLAGDDR